MHSSLKTPADKAGALKDRMDAQRRLGAQIDVLMRQADAEPSGCGICGIWRRLSGRQRSSALAVAAESGVGSVGAVATGTTTQGRLFGMKKADPHAKLAEAAASMESRIGQLECKAASEREEAKRHMQTGNRQSAMRMLKRAKATEKQLEANQASLLAVEQQVDLMAQAAMQKQIASALSASSKGMKAQKKMLKNAESAVDDAQDARDMADDLGNVMSEFAANGQGDGDDDDLMEELQGMMDGDPPGPASVAMVDVSLDDQGSSTAAAEYAKAQEIARLEARLARYDSSAEARDAVAAMPAAPTELPTRANGKGKMSAAQAEKERLLGVVSSSNGH